MAYIYLFATIFLFSFLGRAQCEEYKCCNNSANGFNCKNSYDSLPTAPRNFIDHNKASLVCKNYPSYKTESGAIKNILLARRHDHCELCQTPGESQQVGENHFICRTCLGNIENYLAPECPICLGDEDESLEIFQCKHSLHEACRPRSMTECPICRSTINRSIKGLKRADIIGAKSENRANDFDEEPIPLLVFMKHRNLERNHHMPSLNSSDRAGIERFGQVESGLMKRSTLDELAGQVISSQQKLNDHRYEQVALDPEQARSEDERLAALTAREFFILVDRSLGMSIPHKLMVGKHAYQPSSLWDSAKLATSSIVDLASALDVDNRVTVMFWNGNNKHLEKDIHIVSSAGECEQIFRRQSPRGTSELGLAFNSIYRSHLKALFEKDEPFTVVVLTANVPTDMGRIDSFFNKVVKENSLEVVGKETRAAFTMVNLGTNSRVSEAFFDLKNRLVYYQHLNVDLIEVKHADFLFGIGPHLGQKGVGPFALVWNAIFD